MVHKNKARRFVSKRISFKQKTTPLRTATPSRPTSRRRIERLTIDTDSEKLFQQLRAKTEGRVPSSRPPQEFIKPLNIRKSTELNFRNLFIQLRKWRCLYLDGAIS